MFRGIGKQVVVLKNTDSAIFEEAIFIVKDGARASRADMLSECERIISKNSTEDGRIRLRRNKSRLMIYGFAGALLVIAGLIIYIICCL